MKISRLFSWLLYGGDSRLNHPEVSIIDAVAQYLGPEEGGLLRKQISEIKTVQRPQPGRITMCYYRKRKPPPTFSNTDYEKCLATIQVEAPNGRKRKCKLMIHRGLFQSFEGYIPDFEVIAHESHIVLWPDERSTTPDAIDRLEHGKPETLNKRMNRND